MTVYILNGRSYSGFKDGERYEYKKGDTVELTKEQFEAFKDQFEEAPKSTPQTVTQKVAAPQPQSESK